MISHLWSLVLKQTAFELGWLTSALTIQPESSHLRVTCCTVYNCAHEWPSPLAQNWADEIQSPLGAGGMGDMYRARDTRLRRTVAIKILPEHLCDSPEARLRFDREAQALSSFNHPNICQLYDVGEQDGTRFLVMEYLEGETLADRLRKGPLPLEQVLKIGIEMCESLEHTAAEFCIAILSRATSCSQRAAPSSWISGWQKAHRYAG